MVTEFVRTDSSYHREVCLYYRLDLIAADFYKWEIFCNVTRNLVDILPSHSSKKKTEPFLGYNCELSGKLITKM